MSDNNHQPNTSPLRLYSQTPPAKHLPLRIYSNRWNTKREREKTGTVGDGPTERRRERRWSWSPPDEL
ncbi:hypothetical protein Hanom_Chr03g00214951 [Helianthus anomalus]